MNGQYTHLRDWIDQYVGPEITDFADLRKQYGTGRSYLISSNPEKKYGYRIGVQTRIGDIEQSEWIRQAEELIERRGGYLMRTVQTLAGFSLADYRPITKVV